MEKQDWEADHRPGLEVEHSIAPHVSLARNQVYETARLLRRLGNVWVCAHEERETHWGTRGNLYHIQHNRKPDSGIQGPSSNSYLVLKHRAQKHGFCNQTGLGLNPN